MNIFKKGDKVRIVLETENDFQTEYGIRAGFKATVDEDEPYINGCIWVCFDNGDVDIVPPYYLTLLN